MIPQFEGETNTLELGVFLKLSSFFKHGTQHNTVVILLIYHRENGGTLGMVPLIINPIYTLYSGYLDVFIG